MVKIGFNLTSYKTLQNSHYRYAQQGLDVTSSSPKLSSVVAESTDLQTHAG